MWVHLYKIYSLPLRCGKVARKYCRYWGACRLADKSPFHPKADIGISRGITHCIDQAIGCQSDPFLRWMGQVVSTSFEVCT